MNARRRRALVVAAASGALAAAIVGGTWAARRLPAPAAVGPPRTITRPKSGDAVTVVLGGDFAPVEGQLARMAERGPSWPYLPTRDLFHDADVAFANLEAPVTGRRAPFRGYKDFLYRAPPETLPVIAWTGLDAVSLANNHAIDYREGGLLDTVAGLDAHGVVALGAGASEAEARRGLVVDVGGTRIGLLAYLEDTPVYDLYLDTFARGDRPGVARLDRRAVAADVRRLRPLVDVLVVSVHWGENYAPVTARQEEEARWLAGLGVDVICGHHPHDVQPVEWRGRTLVLYSLGNWAWGAEGHAELRVGLVARLGVVDKRLAWVELLPIATQNRITDYQPRLLRLDEREWLDPFLAASRRRGTVVTLDGTTVRLTPPATAR